MSERESTMLARLAATDAALPPTSAPPIDVVRLGRNRARRRVAGAAVATLVVATGLFAYQSSQTLDREREALSDSEPASAAMIAALTRAADRLERDVASSVAELRASRAHDRARVADAARQAHLDNQLATVRAEAALALAGSPRAGRMAPTENTQSRTNR